MDDTLLKLLKDFGTTGLLLVFLWKAGSVLRAFADKYAEKFLEAHTKQAEAMALLAHTVQTSAGGQQEVLLATRVMAQQLADLKRLIEEQQKEKQK